MTINTITTLFRTSSLLLATILQYCYYPRKKVLMEIGPITFKHNYHNYFKLSSHFLFQLKGPCILIQAQVTPIPSQRNLHALSFLFKC